MSKREYRCLKCGRPIDSAIKGEDPFTAPKDASIFRMICTFGSQLYDLMVEPLEIEVIICDDCMKANKRYFRITKYDSNSN
jgi:hypothetical protein